jgi:hypothetical protein
VLGQGLGEDVGAVVAADEVEVGNVRRVASATAGRPVMTERE